AVALEQVAQGEVVVPAPADPGEHLELAAEQGDEGGGLLALGDRHVQAALAGGDDLLVDLDGEVALRPDRRTDRVLVVVDAGGGGRARPGCRAGGRPRRRRRPRAGPGSWRGPAPTGRRG